ncbi:unnamed protein product [marine sediment metagenome]|uniref:Uncharacterized protein n=1 Tax=marine sediment metagenome TaxID=412755 RepID=X1FKF8_9ZZZZ
MPYYILYPKAKNKSVSIRTRRPSVSRESTRYGFAEGPFSTKSAVIRRLNQMNVSSERRPKGWRK